MYLFGEMVWVSFAVFWNKWTSLDWVRTRYMYMQLTLETWHLHRRDLPAVSFTSQLSWWICFELDVSRLFSSLYFLFFHVLVIFSTLNYSSHRTTITRKLRMILMVLCWCGTPNSTLKPQNMFSIARYVHCSRQSEVTMAKKPSALCLQNHTGNPCSQLEHKRLQFIPISRYSMFRVIWSSNYHHPSPYWALFIVVSSTKEDLFSCR